jgi:hypothetical protein
VTVWYTSGGLILDNNFITWVVLWFGQHPFGAATMVYAASVFVVLLYSYFEPRDFV